MGTFLSGVATIFYRLVDHSVEISVLICLIFFVKWVAAKKLPSWWHYSLWLILLVRMLLPIEFENRLNVYNFIPDIREHQVFEIIADSSLENVTSAVEFTSIPTKNTPEWRHLLKNSVPVLWLFGAMAFGIFILLKSISFWRSVRRIPPVADKEVLHLLAQCKNRMKISRGVDVVVTDKVRSPALFGYFHPRLLLPGGIFEKLGNEDLSYAFMHELGHLRRHDIGVSWLMAILQVVYWFNPLVWIAFYHVRIDQESACDESVLSRIKHHQSKDYAKAIVGFLEKFYQNCQLPSLAGVMENKTQMKRRIANIVHYKKYSQKLRVAAITLFFSVCFVFYLFSGVAEVKQTQSSMTPEMESALVADATSVVNRDGIINGEIIPGDFFAAGADNASKPPRLTFDKISPSTGKTAGDTEETSREKHVEFGKNEALSQTPAGAVDEGTNIDRNQPVMTPKQISSDAVSSHEAEKSNGSNRIVAKIDDVFLNTPDRRTATAGRPAVMESERKPEEAGNKKQLEEKRTSPLVASVEMKDLDSVIAGSSPVKSGKEFTEKRVVETSRDVSVHETGLNNSNRHDTLQVQDSGILKDSRRGRSTNRQTVLAMATADGGITTGAGNEMFSRNEVSPAIEKTDRGEDRDGAGFSVADVDMPPKVIRSASPHYPYRAIRARITGYIKLRFTVTKDGDAIGTKVVESKPKGVFDKSALEAIESYRFKPGMKDGKAVDVQVSLPIKYI